MKYLKKAVSYGLMAPAFAVTVIGTIAGVIWVALKVGFEDGPELFIEKMIEWKRAE